MVQSIFGILIVQLAMSESLHPAMEIVQHEPCPVMRAWSQSSVVVQQLLKGKLVVLQYNVLGRPAVSDNVELLAPLINHIGASTAILHRKCAFSLHWILLYGTLCM